MDNSELGEPLTMSNKAKALINKFWAWRLKSCPEFGTFSGFHDHDDKLEVFTLEAIHENYVSLQM